MREIGNLHHHTSYITTKHHTAHHCDHFSHKHETHHNIIANTPKNSISSSMESVGQKKKGTQQNYVVIPHLGFCGDSRLITIDPFRQTKELEFFRVINQSVSYHRSDRVDHHHHHCFHPYKQNIIGHCLSPFWE